MVLAKAGSEYHDGQMTKLLPAFANTFPLGAIQVPVQVKYFVKISIVICLLSCGSDGTTKSSGKDSKVSDTSKEKENSQLPEEASLTRLTNSRQILGRWQSHGKETLSVLITGDSIFYLEHHEAHKYIIKGDSIFIDYPESMFSAKVGMVADSLMFESDQGRNKMTRAKGR
jgi:hypothetical protein